MSNTRELHRAAGKTPKNDSWLTPPELLKALGSFDLDPCCPTELPWRTAKRMLCAVVHTGKPLLTSKVFPSPVDGLTAKWSGRVWCNPPYSAPLPWIQKMAEHGDGVLLLPAKSPDTRWGQAALSSGDAFFFLARRLSFHHLSGERSGGKWLPNLLVAYGQRNMMALKRLAQHEDGPFTGVLMERYNDPPR